MADQGEGWLIVDDLVDTGVTAKAVRALLPKAHFATIYAKPNGRPMVDTFITERSEEHTSELQSLMRISYAVFCLKKKKHKTHTIQLLKKQTQHTYTPTHTHHIQSHTYKSTVTPHK